MFSSDFFFDLQSFQFKRIWVLKLFCFCKITEFILICCKQIYLIFVLPNDSFMKNENEIYYETKYYKIFIFYFFLIKRNNVYSFNVHIKEVMYSLRFFSFRLSYAYGKNFISLTVSLSYISIH